MDSFKILCVILALSIGSHAYITPELTTGFAPWMLKDNRLNHALNQFFCVKSSDRIALSSVNDGYCDCSDGSDELGTGACDILPSIQKVNPLIITSSKKTLLNEDVALASFHCKNPGFRAHPIPISRINDGVCDCCDGSDEWATPSLCANTCRQKRQAEESEIQDFLKQHEVAIQKQHEKAEKSSYITLREREMNNLIDTIEEIEKKQMTLGLLSPDHVRTRLQISGDTAYELNMEVQRLLQKENTQKQAENTESEPVKEGEMLFPYPKEYQFIDNKDKALNTAPEKKDTIKKEIENSLLTSSSVIAPARQGSGKPMREMSVGESHMFRNQLQMLLWKERSGKASLLKLSQLSDIGKRVMNFAGECAMGDLEKYSYRFCIDGAATQKEGRKETSLGEFKHVEMPKDAKSSKGASPSQSPTSDTEVVDDADILHDESVVLVYENGERCWNGPLRSLRVTVKCSGVWSIEKVSEPSRCVYEMLAHGPIACEEGLKERIEKMYAGAYNDDDLVDQTQKRQIKDEL